MNKEGKTIIFFSLYYPFSFSDSYVDEEIKLLAENCSRIIVVSFDTSTVERRPTPPNVIVYRFSPYNKPLSRSRTLGLLFNVFFYKELLLILFKYKTPFSLALLSELFAFYGRAISTKDFIQQILHEQKLENPDLLIYTYWMLEPTFAAVLLKKNLPTLNIISRVHSQDVYFFRSPVNYLPFRKFTFNHLNHLYFISANAKKYFEEKHFLTPEEKKKTSIARIGISGPGKLIKKTMGPKLMLISVAFVQKLKRIDLLIDALALLDVPVEWWHLGHCPQSEEYFTEIKKYAAEKFAASPNISFTFTGKTPKADLYKIYAEHNFDLFINVSATEGIPVSMMEAMSYSVPVLGTDVGGVAEIIENNNNGFLVKENITAAEIAALIKEYFSFPGETQNRFRQNAFNTWEQKFNATKNYTAFVESISAI